jgi:hypothetical protein
MWRDDTMIDAARRGAQTTNDITDTMLRSDRAARVKMQLQMQLRQQRQPTQQVESGQQSHREPHLISRLRTHANL